MPSKAPTFQPIRSKRGSTFVKRMNDRQRGSASQRGYGVKWQRARDAYLAAHPLCVECEKRNNLIPATVVDHIVPHKGDVNLFWDSAGNWQALCAPCHNRKTVTEDGGFGNKVKVS